MRSVIFTLFRTPSKRCYVYDRHANSVFEVSQADYEQLRSVERGELDEKDSSVIAHFQSLGMMQPNVITKIEHPMTPYLAYHAQNRMCQLILQVTQQCNLRCAYCPYSGLYPNHRRHNQSFMDFETAKKAIDFYLARTRDADRLAVSFYGGEPLLAFDLIRRCVEYVRGIVEGRELSFNTTTNGTLVKGEIAEFLVENNFHLSISLDGSRSEHDVNRKFANGQGSFDVVMENVRNFTKTYPDYKENVSFATTINPRMDLACTMEFFTTDQIMEDHHIIFNSINEVGLPDSWQFDEKATCLRRYEHMKLLCMLAGKLDEKYVSRLVIASREQYQHTFRMLNQHTFLPAHAHPGGPCLPGIRRLFVTTDGTFYPCEKVSEINAYFRIGSVETGFDFARMRDLLNNAVIIADHCRDCWNIQNCSICSGRVDFRDSPVMVREYRCEPCASERGRILSDLYEIAALREFGYES